MSKTIGRGKLGNFESELCKDRLGRRYLGPVDLSQLRTQDSIQTRAQVEIRLIALGFAARRE